MKKILALFLFVQINAVILSQVQQKVSVNFSAGTFKTIGYELGEDNEDPLQMPHYRPGIMTEAGLQYNISRHFSIMASTGIMYSAKWSYMMGDVDYMHYYVADLQDPELIYSEGLNKLDFFNIYIGVCPKYYFLPARKWNPFLFTQFSLNFIKARFTDNCRADAIKFNALPADDGGPYNPFLEENQGIGFNTGVGVEFNKAGNLAFDARTGFYRIPLKEENFKNPKVSEGFNAFFISAGIRFSFFKTKDL